MLLPQELRPQGKPGDIRWSGSGAWSLQASCSHKTSSHSGVGWWGHTGAIKLGQVQAACEHYDFSLCASVCACTRECIERFAWDVYIELTKPTPFIVRRLILPCSRADCFLCLLLQNPMHWHLFYQRHQCVFSSWRLNTDAKRRVQGRKSQLLSFQSQRAINLPHGACRLGQKINRNSEKALLNWN